jgi:hypothetical protein
VPVFKPGQLASQPPRAPKPHPYFERQALENTSVQPVLDADANHTRELQATGIVHKQQLVPSTPKNALHTGTCPPHPFHT